MLFGPCYSAQSLRTKIVVATVPPRKGAPDAADCPQTRLHRCAGGRSRPGMVGRCRQAAGVAEEIAEVCGRIGFMYVKNHRVAAADIDAIFRTAADFHNLPLETKMLSSMAGNADAQGQGFLHGMTKGTGK